MKTSLIWLIVLDVFFFATLLQDRDMLVDTRAIIVILTFGFNIIYAAIKEQSR